MDNRRSSDTLCPSLFCCDSPIVVTSNSNSCLVQDSKYIHLSYTPADVLHLDLVRVFHAVGLRLGLEPVFGVCVLGACCGNVKLRVMGVIVNVLRNGIYILVAHALSCRTGWLQEYTHAEQRVEANQSSFALFFTVCECLKALHVMNAWTEPAGWRLSGCLPGMRAGFDRMCFLLLGSRTI